MQNHVAGFRSLSLSVLAVIILGMRDRLWPVRHIFHPRHYHRSKGASHCWRKRDAEKLRQELCARANRANASMEVGNVTETVTVSSGAVTIIALLVTEKLSSFAA